MLGTNARIKPNDTLAEESPLTEFIKPADEVSAVAGPADIEFHVVAEHREAEAEQAPEFDAKGEREARPATILAASLAHEADNAIKASNAAQAAAEAARTSFNRARAGLGPYVRRPTDAKVLKWMRWGLIFGGDLVGIAGAALIIGEEPINAFMQGISAAGAAVTLGAVGREVRCAVSARARKRDLDDLSEDEQPYAAFFIGANGGETIVKLVVLTCAAAMLLIAGSIFALRQSAEGTSVGVVFGCLALALGLASFYNSFDTADDVAELLDNEKAHVAAAEKKAERARGTVVINQRAAAQAEAISIKAENKKSGEAAAAGVRRHLHWVLGNSPGVAGNGTRRPPADKRAASNGQGANGNHSGNRKVRI